MTKCRGKKRTGTRDMTTVTAKRRAIRDRYADHPVTIIPQVYRGLGGCRIFVAEMGDIWGVVSEDQMGRRQALKRFTPSPGFETAQQDLDAYADLKGFQAENPLPPDEGEEPDPAPVRHSYRDSQGRLVMVRGVEGGFGAVRLDHDSPEPDESWQSVCKDPKPFPSFESAQEWLDAYAGAMAWQPASHRPLPADKGKHPGAAPVCRRIRDNAQIAKEPKRVAVPDTSLFDGQGAEPPGGELSRSFMVRLDQIRPSPFQTRKEFPEEELRALGESLRRGQLVPIRVRPVGEGFDEAMCKGVGHFELIAGERRVRAARLAGLETLRAEVVELSDEQARWEVGADNEERASFNPIERAHWFKSLLDAGMTQEDLAKRLGWAGQASISNAVGLARLPEKPWQRWIISAEMPAGHVRAVLPYVEYPTLLGAIAKRLIGRRSGTDARVEFPAYEEFLGDVLLDVEQNTRPLDGEDWDRKTCRPAPIFTPTPEQRARLGIIEVPKHTGRGAAKEERAVNVDLWKTWHEAFLVEWRKKHAAKARKAEARADTVKPEKLTKRQVESRAKEAAEKYEKRLEGFRADWLRWLLSERLRDGRDVDVGMVLGLCLYFAASRRPLPSGAWGWQGEIARRGEAFEAIVNGTGHRMLDSTATAARIAMFSELPDCAAHVARWLAAMFWAKDRDQEADHPGQPVPHVPAEDLQVFAHRLGIDPEAAWQKDHCGPLTRRYWELHTKEQLVEMALAVGFWGKVVCQLPAFEAANGRRPDPAKWVKNALVDALLALRPADSIRIDRPERGIPMPAELRPARRGPGRRKQEEDGELRWAHNLPRRLSRAKD